VCGIPGSAKTLLPSVPEEFKLFKLFAALRRQLGNLGRRIQVVTAHLCGRNKTHFTVSYTSAAASAAATHILG
jgi:hypothetical protein